MNYVRGHQLASFAHHITTAQSGPRTSRLLSCFILFLPSCPHVILYNNPSPLRCLLVLLFRTFIDFFNVNDNTFLAQTRGQSTRVVTATALWGVVAIWRRTIVILILIPGLFSGAALRQTPFGCEAPLRRRVAIFTYIKRGDAPAGPPHFISPTSPS